MLLKQGLLDVAVVGMGYVGLPLALLVDKREHSVVGVDIDAAKVKLINSKVSPFLDEELATDIAHSGLIVTTEFAEIANAEVVVICVPTPVNDNHMPDLKPLKSACENIARFIQEGQLIILESTVNPGVSENIVMPILEQGSSLKCGRDFHLAHCPERINPGDRFWNVANISRVVGSTDDVGLRKAVDFYSSIVSAEIKPMASIKEAEAVKIVENAFRDINIAFVNELAQSFSRLGIDVVNVIEGAATKPFAFMPHYPGCGVGGHCIPVDPYYLIEYAKENGFDHDFLSLARRINSSMPRYTAELVVKGLNEKSIAVNGTKVAVLGLAYKPEIDDCRESPSFEIVRQLEENGAEVAVYDPYIPEKSTVESLERALENTHAVVIATAHNAFRELTPAYLLERGVAVVVDGRNCLPKDEFIKAGIVYKGVGK